MPIIKAPMELLYLLVPINSLPIISVEEWVLGGLD